MEVLQTKDNGVYNKFLKYLEEDYDWVAFNLQNTQIPSQEITDFLSSSRLSTAETVTMSEKMRCEQRDRMIRSARNSHHQDAEMERIRHEFRDR